MGIPGAIHKARASAREPTALWRQRRRTPVLHMRQRWRSAARRLVLSQQFMDERPFICCFVNAQSSLVASARPSVWLHRDRGISSAGQGWRLIHRHRRRLLAHVARPVGDLTVIMVVSRRDQRCSKSAPPAAVIMSQRLRTCDLPRTSEVLLPR